MYSTGTVSIYTVNDIDAIVLYNVLQKNFSNNLWRSDYSKYNIIRKALRGSFVQSFNPKENINYVATLGQHVVLCMPFNL